MEHIDPLTLTKQINLRCFGEVFQKRLFKVYLECLKRIGCRLSLSCSLKT